MNVGAVQIAQLLAYLLLGPATSGLIRSAPEFFSEEKIINVAQVNQQRSSEESGQWLENVDRTHLVLASGKPVLQKNIN